MDPAETDPYNPPTPDNFEAARPWVERATELARSQHPITDTAIALGQAYAAGRRQGRAEA